MSLAWEDDQCPRCNSRCTHGVCDCDPEMCRECWRKEQLEKDADREANWQKNVMGPMLGFDKEGNHVHDWRGIDTGRMCAICLEKEEWF